MNKERRLITYDLPLTLNGPDGRLLIVRVVLPADITHDEAERLVGIIRTLPMRHASSAVAVSPTTIPTLTLELP